MIETPVKRSDPERVESLFLQNAGVALSLERRDLGSMRDREESDVPSERRSKIDAASSRHRLVRGHEYVTLYRVSGKNEMRPNKHTKLKTATRKVQRDTWQFTNKSRDVGFTIVAFRVDTWHVLNRQINSLSIIWESNPFFPFYLQRKNGKKFASLAANNPATRSVRRDFIRFARARASLLSRWLISLRRRS